MLTIEDLKLKIDNNSRLLGLDIGSKRIGISICDDKRTIATPLKTVDFINLNELILDDKIPKARPKIIPIIIFQCNANFFIFYLLNFLNKHPLK